MYTESSVRCSSRRRCVTCCLCFGPDTVGIGLIVSGSAQVDAHDESSMSYLSFRLCVARCPRFWMAAIRSSLI